MQLGSNNTANNSRQNSGWYTEPKLYDPTEFREQKLYQRRFDDQPLSTSCRSQCTGFRIQTKPGKNRSQAGVTFDRTYFSARGGKPAPSVKSDVRGLAGNYQKEKRRYTVAQKAGRSAQGPVQVREPGDDSSLSAETQITPPKEGRRGTEQLGRESRSAADSAQVLAVRTTCGCRGVVERGHRGRVV